MINDLCEGHDVIPTDEMMEDYCLKIGHLLVDCGECKMYKIAKYKLRLQQSKQQEIVNGV